MKNKDDWKKVLFISEIAAFELKRATEKFGPFASAHEGISVIREEFDELWEEVKKKYPQSKTRMREEAIQLAAMAMRFVLDITGADGDLE